MKRYPILALLPAMLMTARIVAAAEFPVNSVAGLQASLDIARANGEDDTIIVAAGTYAFNAPATYRGGENRSIIISGAGAGTTILDGGGIAVILSVDNTGLAHDRRATVTIRGLTFRNGYGDGVNQEAGALNAATGHGDIAVLDSAFESNAGAGWGGAAKLESSYGKITVFGCTFTGNAAASGGCIIAQAAIVALKHCDFQDNPGGGPYLSSGSGPVIVRNNRFSRNSLGAKAYSYQGPVIVSGNSFESNLLGGLSAASSFGAVIATGNLIVGNGGGGASITTIEGSLTLTNNTFYGNSSSDKGGGLYLELYYEHAKARLYNNILWANSAPKGADLYIDNLDQSSGRGSLIVLRRNDIGDLVSSKPSTLLLSKNLSRDPLLLAPGAGIYSLSAGSPCIDHGLNRALAIPRKAIDGGPRIQDGNPDGRAVVDIGAYEFVNPSGLTLLQPNGREEILSGSVYPVRWSAPPRLDSFDLDYSVDGGLTWKRIARSVMGNEFNWKVPAVSANLYHCLVMVRGRSAGKPTAARDLSALEFTIEGVRLVSPVAGASLSSSSSQVVFWVTNAIAGKVARTELAFSTDGGVTWEPIQTLTGNPGHHHWAIPVVTERKPYCKVRVVFRSADGLPLGEDSTKGFFLVHPGANP